MLFIAVETQKYSKKKISSDKQKNNTYKNTHLEYKTKKGEGGRKKAKGTPNTHAQRFEPSVCGLFV